MTNSFVNTSVSGSDVAISVQIGPGERLDWWVRITSKYDYGYGKGQGTGEFPWIVDVINGNTATFNVTKTYKPGLYNSELNIMGIGLVDYSLFELFPVIPPVPPVSCAGGPTPKYATGCALLRAYDTDNDGVLTKIEAVQATKDYNAGLITKQEALFVVKAYFAGTAEIPSQINFTCPDCFTLPDGCISFKTSPAGARIEVDTKDTGKVTPGVVCGLSLATHTYRFVLPGYYDSGGAVYVEPGQHTIDAQLNEIPHGMGTGTKIAVGLVGVGILAAILSLAGAGDDLPTPDESFYDRLTPERRLQLDTMWS